MNPLALSENCSSLPDFASFILVLVIIMLTSTITGKWYLRSVSIQEYKRYHGAELVPAWQYALAYHANAFASLVDIIPCTKLSMNALLRNYDFGFDKFQLILQKNDDLEYNFDEFAVSLTKNWVENSHKEYHWDIFWHMIDNCSLSEDQSASIRRNFLSLNYNSVEVLKKIEKYFPEIFKRLQNTSSLLLRLDAPKEVFDWFYHYKYDTPLDVTTFVSSNGLNKLSKMCLCKKCLLCN